MSIKYHFFDEIQTSNGLLKPVQILFDCRSRRFGILSKSKRTMLKVNDMETADWWRDKV